MNDGGSELLAVQGQRGTVGGSQTMQDMESANLFYNGVYVWKPLKGFEEKKCHALMCFKGSFQVLKIDRRRTRRW